MVDAETELSPWQLTVEFPRSFHSLGLHLSEEEREIHLARVAEEVWPGGTDFQREQVLSWYREAASDAAVSGAFYSGFCIASTEDDRITTASILARLDSLREQNATVSAAGIHETVAKNPASDVARVELSSGPGVLALTGLEQDPTEGETEGSTTRVTLARVDLYAPIPVMSKLLVLSLTTPSLSELPDYVGILWFITQSISITPTSRPSPAENGRGSPIVNQVYRDFG